MMYILIMFSEVSAAILYHGFINNTITMYSGFYWGIYALKAFLFHYNLTVNLLFWFGRSYHIPSSDQLQTINVRRVYTENTALLTARFLADWDRWTA